MNPPTREEFEVLKRRFDQLERETEPMRLERRLSIPEANTLQTIMEMVGKMAPDVATLKVQMATKDDISALKNEISAMEKRFDAIAEVQKQILARLPEKGE